jgi:hypothetical protein
MWVPDNPMGEPPGTRLRMEVDAAALDVNASGQSTGWALPRGRRLLPNRSIRRPRRLLDSREARAVSERDQCPTAGADHALTAAEPAATVRLPVILQVSHANQPPAAARDRSSPG